MNKDDLKKLGIEDDDLIQKIIVAHGKDIEKHKADLTAIQTERDGLKTQLDEAGQAIEGFKKLDVDGIKAAADEWKTKAETAKAEADAQISKLKFDHALDGALTGAKAKNAKAVKALLENDLLKLADDGSISGLKEQLEKIQSDNDYLFETDGPGVKLTAGTRKTSTTGTPFMQGFAKGADLPQEK